MWGLEYCLSDKECFCIPLFFFFFNDTATTEIYTLSLHDALPIFLGLPARPKFLEGVSECRQPPVLLAQPFIGGGHHGSKSPKPSFGCANSRRRAASRDRKSTRLNSSHANISYAVFCLKKKNKKLYAEDADVSRGAWCDKHRKVGDQHKETVKPRVKGCHASDRCLIRSLDAVLLGRGCI